MCEYTHLCYLVQVLLYLLGCSFNFFVAFITAERTSPLLGLMKKSLNTVLWMHKWSARAAIFWLSVHGEMCHTFVSELCRVWLNVMGIGTSNASADDTRQALMTSNSLGLLWMLHRNDKLTRVFSSHTPE